MSTSPIKSLVITAQAGHFLDTLAFFTEYDVYKKCPALAVITRDFIGPVLTQVGAYLNACGFLI